VRKLDPTLLMLCERFPAAFFLYERKRKPLKIGIHHDVAAMLGDEIDAKRMRRAMRHYFVNAVFLAAMKEGAIRIDLDGKPAGVVTADEAMHAGTALDEGCGVRAATAQARAGKAEGTTTASATTEASWPGGSQGGRDTAKGDAGTADAGVRIKQRPPGGGRQRSEVDRLTRNAKRGLIQ
jgi:ProP effector